MVAFEMPSHGQRRVRARARTSPPGVPFARHPYPARPPAQTPPGGGGERVAIEVATPAAEEPSELEAAVLAAASGYRFGEIEVPATIARAIESMGFVTPTEVQDRAIPPLRRGEDLIGQAQTGTGKTAAFGIPIVEKIEPSSRTSRP